MSQTFEDLYEWHVESNTVTRLFRKSDGKHVGNVVQTDGGILWYASVFRGDGLDDDLASRFGRLDHWRSEPEARVAVRAHIAAHPEPEPADGPR